MSVNDLEKGRAKFAYICVKNFVDTNDEEKNKKYRGYVRNISSMILNNGLGSTLAFMFSKKFKKEGKVYNAIAQNIYDWIAKDENKYLLELDNKDNAEDKLEELMNKVINLNSSTYQMLNNEILAFLVWLKRLME